LNANEGGFLLVLPLAKYRAGGIMSALISPIFLGRMLLVTDTYAASVVGAAQKLYPLPAFPALIAGRGSARLLATVALEAGAVRDRAGQVRAD
jgi:hypothetical protein